MSIFAKYLCLFAAFVSGEMVAQSTLHRADSLYENGQFSDAAKLYANISNERGQLQLARSFQAIGLSNKARETYEKLWLYHPDFLLAGFELGKWYATSGKPDLAKNIFKTLISKDSLNPEYYYRLGLLEKTTNSYKSALENFLTAIRLDSLHLKSVYQTGVVYTMFKAYNAAAEQVDKGLAIDSTNLELTSIRAQIYFNNRDYTEAIDFYQKLLTNGQSDFFIYRDLAESYERVGNLEWALCYYEKAFALTDDDPEILFTMSKIYLNMEEPDFALKLVNQAIEERQYNFVREYMHKGEIFKQQKDYKSALEAYLEAHEELPEDPTVYFQVCILANFYYKDPQTKLNYFKAFLNKYGDRKTGFEDFVQSRISALNAEIHLSKE
ncbi:MAG: tetratricopeptide repeat protein [Bacteroidetes bacterium]|nr:tetratricopeptide repeat protein [Bacteroidota bacterium]